MAEVVQLAEVAALVGDPARASMLTTLMDGSARTAAELAWCAGIRPPTASGHLGRLQQAGLLTLSRQGRHHYFRLASPEVARMIEAIGAVAAPRAPRLSREAQALREARTCYDHLAGRVAVALTDGMVARGHLMLEADGGVVTRVGEQALADFGIDLAAARQGRRCFCRTCLDWTERRPHIGGAVGAALLARCLELGWVRRQRDSRAIRVTPVGQAGLASRFAVDMHPCA
jgi:DNA-binding transcriptional ArsR family regulator